MLNKKIRKFTMAEKTERAITDRAYVIHRKTAVIDALGGSAFAFVDILE
jgi:hypothetical protein